MTPRLPSAWIVAALSGALGVGVGGGTAALAIIARPMRIGDFSGWDSDAGVSMAGGRPAAEIDCSEFDFGSMESLRSGTHHFRITNGGGAPLKLSKGRSSCGCTIAAFDKEEIAPGDAGSVTITWRTKGEGGTFRQQVTIHTNDPRRPDISLRIAGNVVPVWRATPAAVVFPKLSRSTGETATVTVLTYLPRPPSPLRLAMADSSKADFFSLESRPLTKGELEATGDLNATGGFAITIATRPGLPLGPLRERVRGSLLTDEAGRAGRETSADEGGGGGGDGEKDAEAVAAWTPPNLETSVETAEVSERPAGEIVVEIPVEGNVAGDLAVTGKAWDSQAEAVTLGSVSSRSGLRTEVFLTVKGPNRETVRPRLKEVLPKSLVVDIGESKPVGAGTVWRVPITLSIPSGSPQCNHLGNQQGQPGRIVLETGHPDAPILEIPVKVSIGP